MKRRYARQMFNVVCRHCGIPFSGWRKDQLACSKECRQLYLRATHPTPKSGAREISINGITKRDYVLVAERAYGNPLPKGVVVHHVDEDRSNCTSANLVICQDQGYHKLLHRRAKIVRAGGDPDLHKLCSTCGCLQGFSSFALNPTTADGFSYSCRQCIRKNQKAWREINRLRINERKRHKYSLRGTACVKHSFGAAETESAA